MITCTEHNLAEFRGALRAHPDLQAFVAALHQAGMIDGLRHIRIAPYPPGLPCPPEAVTPALSAAAESRLLDRAHAQMHGGR